MVGDKVNTSARLMCAVPGVRGIVCDLDTLHEAQEYMSLSSMELRIKFLQMAPMKLKGKKELQCVYRVSNKKSHRQITRASFLYRMKQDVVIVGRDEEISLITEQLQAIKNKKIETKIAWGEKRVGIEAMCADQPSPHGAILIEGPSGSGKT